MRSFLIAAGLLAVAGWGVVEQLPEREAQAEPHSVNAPRIQSVSLDGGPRLPMAALREVLETHAGDALEAATLEHDRAAMQDALAARGYLAAKVGAAEVTYDHAGGAFVTFAVESGPEFHVRTVNVVGASAKDAGVVTLSTGDVVSPLRISEARDALADRLAARGKKAAVTVDMTTDQAAAAVDVVLSAQR
jgi:outer membrane protein assembly factor BamA